MQIVIKNDLTCPNCGITETVADYPDVIFIRGFKVHDRGHWWSQCLVCSGGWQKADVIGYHDKQVWEWDQEKHDPKKGWFY